MEDKERSGRLKMYKDAELEALLDKDLKSQKSQNIQTFFILFFTNSNNI